MYQWCGKKLREAREKQNMTQADLARAYECSRSNICNMEKGLHAPQAENLLKLADVLKVRNIRNLFRRR